MSSDQQQDRQIGLNTLSPASGSRRNARRVGRGIGSGYGKTAGRGHKGQKSRSGGNIPASFEGGQTALHMRLPKFGFTSRVSRITDQVRLHELNRIAGDEVTLESLRAAGLINKSIKRVRIVLKGTVERAFKVTAEGIKVTAGARQAIEAAGGKVETAVAEKPAAKKTAAKKDAKPAAEVQQAETEAKPEEQAEAKPEEQPPAEEAAAEAKVETTEESAEEVAGEAAEEPAQEAAQESAEEKADAEQETTEQADAEDSAGEKE